MRQPFGRAMVPQLAADGEKADALGVALRPFLTLADRNGRNKGRGSHERKKNQSDEQIEHGTDHPIDWFIGCPIQGNERSRGE